MLPIQETSHYNVYPLQTERTAQKILLQEERLKHPLNFRFDARANLDDNIRPRLSPNRWPKQRSTKTAPPKMTVLLSKSNTRQMSGLK